MNVFIMHAYLLLLKGLELKEDEKNSILTCQTCEQRTCKYRQCNENIYNTVFCVTDLQTSSSSPSSSMDTTPMKPKTSANEPMTSYSHYITNYTTKQEQVSEQVSASKTPQRIGRCLVDVVNMFQDRH